MTGKYRTPTRSPARSCNGMVSAANPLAVLAGVDMLRNGGNAVDAAITAMAVLGVVETLNLGLGGDCFALYAPKGSNGVVAYNGSGRAPKAADAEWYRENGYSEVPAQGPHSVTIPGAVEAWARMAADHGTRSLDELLAPAIRYAEEGYPVHDTIASWWAGDVEKLRGDPEAARILLWNGEAPTAGTIHRQPDLARTLRLIAQKGAEGFYSGWVAEAIVSHLRAGGGFHTLEDFANHVGEYVEPISLPYRSHEVFECPPNGQGLAALVMLGILAGFDLSTLDAYGADRLHLAIEAGKVAIQCRDRFVGDPSAVGSWPICLTEKFLDNARVGLDRTRASCLASSSSISMTKDTCHVAVVDRDCNSVSLIASIFHNFGSGLVAPATGVVLQNRGHGFVLTKGHPNELGPLKRPLHTIIPALVCQNERISHVLGVVGGHYQAWGQTHVITNLIDFGFDVQQAIDAPRVFHNGTAVEIERGIEKDVISELQRRHHQVISHEDMNLGRTGRLGGGQLIGIDWANGAFVGAADPRLDGCALGY